MNKGKETKPIFTIWEHDTKETIIKVVKIDETKDGRIALSGYAMRVNISFNEDISVSFKVTEKDKKIFINNIHKFDKSNDEVLVIEKNTAVGLSQKEFNELLSRYAKNIMSHAYYEWLQSQKKEKYVI